MSPPLRYPVYIPSKGRHDSRLTARALDLLRVPYRMAVEPSEYDAYAAHIEPARLLRLPEDFSARGQGSIPVRNWIWEHSIREGHDRHWILDDNISEFYRLNYNRRIRVTSAGIFRAVENFTDRYENIAFSGMNYDFFVIGHQTKAPFALNTRVYSMILVNNSAPYRWRGRYNEDTDLCLQALKGGWCIVLFNAFLGKKIRSMAMKGGNTDTVYATGDKRRAFAESLVEQHPDVARVVWRYNRWHHEVDYSPFQSNRLRLKPGTVIPEGVNEYGMRLAKVTEPSHAQV